MSVNRAGSAHPCVRLAAAALLLASAGVVPARAAIWPEQWASYRRGPVKPAPVADAALADEYGLDASEQAEFSDGAKKFTGTAWRLKDATGALAWWETLRPPDAQSSDLVDQAATLPGGVVLQFGNYVLRFDGLVPTKDQLDTFVNILPKMQDSAVPPLYRYFPQQNLVPNSQRYILGPVSLERFAPQVPVGAAGLSSGAEGQVARFKAGNGEVELAVFVYPTPLMARARQAEFQQLAGVTVKRAGPLVGLALRSPGPDATERVLARLSYKATVTWDQDPSKEEFNIGRIVIGNILLSGALIGGSIAAGALFAGARMLSRRFGITDASTPFTLLGLGKK